MYPNKTLTPGTTSADVTALQQFLMNQGFQIPAGATGYYGDQTKNAVAQWQKAMGVDTQGNDGYWGPRSIAVASQPAGGGSQMTASKPGAKPPTPAEIAAVEATHPDVQANPQVYKTFTDSYNAAGGDITKMENSYGTPFSQADQQQAMAEASSALDPYYAAETQKDTQDAESAMAKSQNDYQTYLQTAGQSFQEDKTKLDQNSADQGVLFSGGRKQKEQNLQNAYQTEGANKLATLTSNVGNTARDYQYKYGNNNANNLSKYFTAGTNTYNPNVATGGVGSSGLSSIYNVGASNYQGTNINAANAAKQSRAAGLLWNKGNKLVSTGYKNQY
jgi:hypothetical protein